MFQSEKNLKSFQLTLLFYRISIQSIICFESRSKEVSMRNYFLENHNAFAFLLKIRIKMIMMTFLVFSKWVSSTITQSKSKSQSFLILTNYDFFDCHENWIHVANTLLICSLYDRKLIMTIKNLLFFFHEQFWSFQSIFDCSKLRSFLSNL